MADVIMPKFKPDWSLDVSGLLFYSEIINLDDKVSLVTLRTKKLQSLFRPLESKWTS